MRIPMQPNLVPSLHNLANLRREGLRRVRRREPRCFDVVLGEQGEEAVDADGCAENAAREVGWVCGAAVARV